MSTVTDRKVARSAAIAKDRIVVPLPTATSQTGVVAFKYTPGYAFRLERVRSYARVKADTISGKVKIATREAVPALSFTQATEVDQTLSTTDADVIGAANEAISLEYTSDGSGALTNGVVVIEIRPQVAKDA